MNQTLQEQVDRFDSLTNKEKVDYFCAVVSKLGDIICHSDKNVFESVVSTLNISPRYHKQLLNSGLLLLFNNVWTHHQLVRLCEDLLEYNEAFVCNTGNDLSDEDISDFIMSKINQ